MKELILPERYYNLTVWHKHSIDVGFTEEHYTSINESVFKDIMARYNTDYMNGEYVALKFEYEIAK